MDNKTLINNSLESILKFTTILFFPKALLQSHQFQLRLKNYKTCDQFYWKKNHSADFLIVTNIKFRKNNYMPVKNLTYSPKMLSQRK